MLARLGCTAAHSATTRAGVRPFFVAGKHTKRSENPLRTSKACWQSFLDWLDADAPGMPTFTLWLALGPVWRLVPLAQQTAAALGPWLLALLDARQRARLDAADEWPVIQQDLLARPMTQAEAERERAAWASWHIEADLLRLVRVVEAPMSLCYRSGWLEWQVRYWALVITLARIGQRYALLARQGGAGPEDRLLACAEAVWQHATQAEPILA
jgi:hypothetical protein